MNSNLLKNILQSVTPIVEAEWQDFEQYFSSRRLDKNEWLWKEGDVCRHLVFLSAGSLYCYHNKGDKEIVTNLYFENAIFYDDYSFITQDVCSVNYVALEACELIVIPRVGVYNMYDKYKSFERLGRMMVERNHVLSIKEQLNFAGDSAETKYRKLLALQPDVIQRVPLKIIASYLDITPEHLSRIRNKIAAA